MPGGAPSGRRPARHLWPYGFVLPALVMIICTFAYPLVEVVRFSFYSGSLGSLVYVGIANYEGLWQDPVFVGSLLNNIKLLTTVPIMTVLALIIALVLNAQIRGWRQYRTIVFLPYILPATAIGLTFSFLLAENGVLNTQLRNWHLGLLAQDWLGSASHVVPTIGGVIIWQQLGFGVVVFAAALLAVPQELVEAARDRRRHRLADPVVHPAAANPPGDRVLHDRRGDHGSLRHLHLCLCADQGRSGGFIQRHGILYLRQWLR